MAKPKESGTAVLVRHGVYQYVRLPKEFQFEGDEVQIARYRNGVILRALIGKTKTKQRKQTES